MKIVADGIGWLLFHIDKQNKKWAYYNLDIIFKDKPLTKEEKDKIVRKLYKQTAAYAIEYIKIGDLKAGNYHKFGELEGFENVDKALEMGKGLIVITAHIGNWDYLGSIAAKLGKTFGAIINRQENPYTDKWLKDIREKKGKILCFYNEISDMTRIIRSLKKGGIIATVADQTYYFKPIFVPFFGVQSATADGPARLHLRFGSPIIMAFAVKRDDGKYRFIYEEPVVFKPTDDLEKDCKKIMTWVNQKYEYYIRKYPEQWFSLLHPRWERTKPEDFLDIEYDPY